MAALGRILQIVGWLWVIAGFAGTMFGLLDLSFLPGIILVFVARIIRNQAARSEMPELGNQGEVEEDEPEPEPTGRMMNTERRRQTERTAPEPAVVETEPEEPTPVERNELLEQIVGAGREQVTEEDVPSPERDGSIDAGEARRQMSSAEMIARAHERWDSKPR